MLAFTKGDGTYNIHGALAMSVIVIINVFFAGFSSMTVTTRIGFAMARDGAFPWSNYLYKVSNENKTPIRMIFMVFFLDALLCLLPLVSPLAFTAITSVAAVGYQFSYGIPIFLRLTVSKDTFIKSTFNLGCFSVPLGWISVFWLFVTTCISFFPTIFDD